MTVSLIALLSLSIFFTAFLSGVFGMAGGMVLIGVLLVTLPVPTAMMVHAITQMASNVSRAVIWRRHIRWRTAAAYVAGCTAAVLVWLVVAFAPTKGVAFVGLGIAPFLVHLLPARFAADPTSAKQGVIYGFLCMSLMLLTGVAGPLLDSFFLGGRLDRREIIATKGMCQVLGHGFKLIYFGAITGSVAALDPLLIAMALGATFLGAAIAKPVLETMSDARFRAYAQILIVSISGYYVVHGGYLMLFQVQ